jgi:hypothetical protein
MDAAAAGSKVIVTPRRTHVAHAWLTAEEYRMLELEAQLRRVHPDQLAARILATMLAHDAVGLLLDR